MVTKSEQFARSSAFSRAGGARSARRNAIDAIGQKPAPTELPVGLISQNPDNPRDHLRDLNDMTETVRHVGVVNAITVATIDAYLAERPERAGTLDPGTTHLVIDGHRRLEAARRAGLDTIKVTVHDALVSTDESLLEAAFVSNYHRDNMTELEEAIALEKLVKFYGGQSKAAKRLGIGQSTISSKLSFLKLSPELQADLAEGRRTGEQLRNLGKLSPEEQRAQADARAAEARQRPEKATRPVQPEPQAKTEPQDYHAVIIDPSEAPPSVADAATPPLPEQPRVPATGRGSETANESVEVPEPRLAAVSSPATEEVSDQAARRLPSQDPDELKELVIAELPKRARRDLTRKLLRYMTTEDTQSDTREAPAPAGT
ncbi:ParB/RepB/Spo0J family partition protein [Streptomyces sp. NPDC002785]|uniref:ParB/RepB/Spo0J family partition protein n=1 Tax=Streptomyces sp. NPDC002785 TaxID=3154543 RepID=UPI00331E5383